MNQLAGAIGDLLGQWAAARQAKHEQEAQDLQQKAEQEAAQMEADSNAEDQRARERAAFLADPSGASMPATPSGPGDDTAKLRAQLYAQGQNQGGTSPDGSQIGATSDSATQTVAQGDAGPTPPVQAAALDPSDQMAQLRAQMTAQAQAQQSETDAAASQAQAPAAPAALSAVYPQNAAFLSAMQSVQNPQPSPAVIAAVQNEVDVADPPSSIMDQLNDKLQVILTKATNEVTSIKATIGTLMNTPTAQLFSAMYSGDVPAPVASDTPEQMQDKVYAQAVIGFEKFTSEAPPKAIYDYTTANINQGMAQLGFAVAPAGDDGQQ